VSEKNPENYEFSSSENLTIERTARFARAFGVVSAVIGVLATLDVVLTMAKNSARAAELPQTLAAVLVGVIFVRVAAALQLVVNTEGNDVQHMMEAVKKLGDAFLIQLAVTAIAVLAMVLIGHFLAMG